MLLSSIAMSAALLTACGSAGQDNSSASDAAAVSQRKEESTERQTSDDDAFKSENTTAADEPACLPGIASPLCMYGTIPVAASFRRQGMREDWLASFMMASILLNLQLIIYSAALGRTALTVRIVTCFICGITAGLLVFIFYRDKEFFDFTGFEERASHDTHPNLLVRYLLNYWRNVKATGGYFLFGILLSALFQRYVPQGLMTDLFGGNEAWGVLMAATIGVPLYACGGGTIPLLQEWLWDGMSMGSAAAFMLTGPSTKITNLGALKIVMGWKRFLLYLAFVMAFSFGTGVIVNFVL